MNKKMISFLAASAFLSMSSLGFCGNGPETINLKEKFSVKGNKPAVISPIECIRENLDAPTVIPLIKAGL